MLYPQVGRRMKHPFYFPLLFLRPNLEGDLTIGQYAIAVRKWSTSTFDLATLATQHDLHIPYQVMDVMLSQCNIELAICDVTSHDQAIEHLDYFRVGAYLAGCSPFVVPFVTTKSVNEYSGINERDSALPFPVLLVQTLYFSQRNISQPQFELQTHGSYCARKQGRLGH